MSPMFHKTENTTFRYGGLNFTVQIIVFPMARHDNLLECVTESKLMQASNRTWFYIRAIHAPYIHVFPSS